MAKIEKKALKTTSKKNTLPIPFKVCWDKNNYMLFGLGGLLSIIGFYFMSVSPWDSKSALVISPVILLITYLGVFPAAILYRSKNKNQNEEV